MEDESFVCKGCRKRRPRNPHLAPGAQQFCSAPACQRQRRSLWQRNRLKSDPAYKKAQREADACWREHSAPDYHKAYRADLKKPAAQRRPRRPMRRPRRDKRRALTVALGALHLRLTVVGSSAGSQGAGASATRSPDLELAVIRIQRVSDEDAAHVVGAKDGRVPSPAILIGSRT